MNQTLSQFAKQNSWNTAMNSGGLDSWDNYSGSDLGDLVVVCSRTRDSDIMTESNFESALKMLDGESDDVQIHRFGHWGCGWFELLLVNPLNETKLEIAYNIKKSLEEYPVLDDTDYCDREREEIHEQFEQYCDDFVKAVNTFIGTPEDYELSEEELTEIKAIASAVFEDDCAYQGYSDAFVTQESIERACIRGGCTGILDELARNGNLIAEMMVECYK